jgi:hypothetical protein
LAIVTERWDGMRWTLRHRARDGIAGRDKLRERSLGRADERCRGVRQNRVDLTPQWSASSLRKASRPDRARMSRKAIAQGMSDHLRCPVCSCACSCARLHTRPRVQRASGIPCSLFFRGTTNRKPRAGPAARTRTHIWCLKFVRRPGQASNASADLRCAIAHRGTHTP